MTSTYSGSGPWLWVDVETTGLDPETLDLLEVAVVATTPDLEILAQWSSVMPGNTEASYNKADEYVRNMHMQNGLWKDQYVLMQKVPTFTLAVAESMIIHWAAELGVTPGSDRCGPMFGQGVAYDREVLRAHMPNVRRLWNHRVVDVSGLRLLAAEWCGLDWSGKAAHRALDDILGSIEIMRWLKREAFRSG